MVSTEQGIANKFFDAHFYKKIELRIKVLLKKLEKINFQQDLFDRNEISDVVSTLDASKSPGIDNLGVMFWQRAGDGGISLLHFFLNWFMKVGYLPLDLKTAVITSVFKKGSSDHSIVDNYRPISVLNTLLKILEILLLRHISGIIDDNTLNPMQSGFRNHRSTYDNLIPVDTAIRQANFESNPLFVDIKKLLILHGEMEFCISCNNNQYLLIL